MAWGPITPRQAPAEPDDGQSAAHAGETLLAHGAAMDQARQVFLAGNGLPQHWQGRRQFNVLDTGFGLGHKLLATWQAWQACRRDGAGCERLCIVAIVPQPPSGEQLRSAHAAAADPQLQAQVSQLLVQWPPGTPDLHVLDFEAGALRLMLAFGHARQVLPDLVMQADAIYLDEHLAVQPGLQTNVLRQLPRLCAPGATLATQATDAASRQAIAACGFELLPPQAGSAPPAMTTARFAPRHLPPPPPGRSAAPRPRSVAVIGAGVAGAAVARALALQGVQVQVLEAEPTPASAASGNAAGLFHSVLHAHDGSHARWLRAAGLHAERVFKPLITQGQVPGRIDGLLRGERTLTASAMHAQLARHHQPTGHVQVRPAAGEPGMPDGRPAWFFPGGGWVSPVDLVGHWLATPGVSCHTGARAERLVALAPAPAAADRQAATTDSPAWPWQVQAADGTVLAEADAVVLANAQDAVRLLNPDPDAAQCEAGAPAAVGDVCETTAAGAVGAAARIPAPWPLQRVRGQTTLLPATASGVADLPLALPLADGGYALRMADGRVLCGAVAQPGDEDPQLREADHRRHLATLQRLTGWSVPEPLPDLGGKVGWRLVADDKLPLLGPVPGRLGLASGTGQGRPLTQVRQVPRIEGLWVITALGSRGLTVAALGGELLAARLLGLPWPVPASVADALDPARFEVRAARHAKRPPAEGPDPSGHDAALARRLGDQAQSKDSA